MNCFNCGAAVPPTAKFCTTCGSKYTHTESVDEIFKETMSAIERLDRVSRSRGAFSSSTSVESICAKSLSKPFSKSSRLLEEALRAYAAFQAEIGLDVTVRYSAQTAEVGDSIQYAITFNNRSKETLLFTLQRSSSSGKDIEVHPTLIEPIGEATEQIVEVVSSGVNHVVSGLVLNVTNYVSRLSASFELDSFSLPVTRPQHAPVTNTITNTVTIQGRGVVDASNISIEAENKLAEETFISVPRKLVSPSFLEFLTSFSPDPYVLFTSLVLPLHDELLSIPGLKFDYSRPRSKADPLLTLESQREGNDLYLTGLRLRYGDKNIAISEIKSVDLFSVDSGDRILLSLGAKEKEIELSFPSSSLSLCKLIAKFFRCLNTESPKH
jgi:hypothetical protein